MDTKLFGACALLALHCVGAASANAQQADGESRGDTQRDVIVVYGERYLQPESQIATIRSEQDRLPGGSNFLDLEGDIKGSERTLDTVMSFEPGVVMQPFFSSNDQVRINIRGSGIQDNPVNRGLMLLFDGMPLNQADGSFIIGLVDPSQARFVSVFRGANGTSWGGTTLGGALNMTARNGHNSVSSVRIAGGSDGTFDGRVKGAFASGDWDFGIVGGYSTSDGHRTLNESERTNVMANVGYSFSADAETRFYISYTDNVFDIPFVLQKDIALSNRDAVIGDGLAGGFAPPSALPAPAVALWNAFGGWDGVFNVNSRRPFRDTQQVRIANKTSFVVGNSRHEIGLSYEEVDDTFTDPLTHTVVEAKTWSANYRLDYDGALLTSSDRIQFSAVFYGGEMPRQYYTNNALTGERDFLYGDFDLDAMNLAIGGQWTGAVSDTLDLYIGAQYFHSDRDIQGQSSTPPPPPDPVVVSLSRDFDYDAFNPKVGLIYRPTDNVRLFANVSRSAETPTFNHLLAATVGPFAGFSCAAPFCNAALFSGVKLQDVEKQTATTFEVGADGQIGDFGWEATYYYSDIEDELITLVSGFAVNAATTNYTDGTIHQGLELGLNGVLARGVLTGNDSITARLAYNYSNFEFDGGVFDGNQIAGVPEHLIRAELAWNLADRFTLAPNITWQPSNTPTDHSNVQYQDDYILLGLKSEITFGDSLKVFADLQNITDTEYATSYVIRGISEANQATFLPGPGFRMFVGVEVAF